MVEGLTLQLRGGRTQSGVQPKEGVIEYCGPRRSPCDRLDKPVGLHEHSLAGPNPLVPSATAGVKLRGRNAYGETAAASSGVPLER